MISRPTPTVLIEDSVPGRLCIVIPPPAGYWHLIWSFIFGAAVAATIYYATIEAFGMVLATVVGISLVAFALSILAFMVPLSEEYSFNSVDRHTKILIHSQLRTIQKAVDRRDVATVCLKQINGEDYSYRVQLISGTGRMLLRIPANDIYAVDDCRRIGRALASALGVSLHDDIPKWW